MQEEHFPRRRKWGDINKAPGLLGINLKIATRIRQPPGVLFWITLKDTRPFPPIFLALLV